MTELAVFAVLMVAMAILFCAIAEIQRLDEENEDLKQELQMNLRISANINTDAHRKLYRAALDEMQGRVDTQA